MIHFSSLDSFLAAVEIPSSIEDIFNDDCCINITKQTPSFWILAHALKEFVAKEGQGNLPVRGTIPDMIAYSSKNIKLQNVYREKAKKDAAAVGNHVAKLLQSVGQVSGEYMASLQCCSLWRGTQPGRGWRWKASGFLVANETLLPVNRCVCNDFPALGKSCSSYSQ
ncbi:NEDD8-activating enzyme E1 regulatory subunit-like isoform X2 [Rattus norvegicus]|uniref:NEDD8-activating enzyme E1 regulatory subunit-like isoform X2 n=1 Tax=Rattus norvegicus TaxID=10116 RepID=UPI0019178A9A|nr:NEDD8-activating enzyme E1 regulatory subunit-like isoform X2 [Rattus norvegicus]